MNLYSQKIVIGAHPKVVLRDSRMTATIDAALEMRSHLSSINEIFNIEGIY